MLLKGSQQSCRLHITCAQGSASDLGQLWLLKEQYTSVGLQSCLEGPKLVTHPECPAGPDASGTLLSDGVQLSSGVAGCMALLVSGPAVTPVEGG